MQTVDTKVNRRTLTGLDDLFLNLLGHFGHHFFDTSRMDTSVLNELMQRQTCYLTAYGIESRQGDSLRRIVHDDLHAGSGF